MHEARITSTLKIILLNQLKAWITIIILLIMLVVMTFIALTVGALVLRRSSFTQLNKNPQNCTNLMEDR